MLFPRDQFVNTAYAWKERVVSDAEKIHPTG
jgi:hypothetical protein